MPKQPIVLVRIRGISKLSPAERKSLFLWLLDQVEYVRDHQDELSDDFVSRCFSLPKHARAQRKESRWKRFRKWVGI